MRGGLLRIADAGQLAMIEAKAGYDLFVPETQLLPVMSVRGKYHRATNAKQMRTSMGINLLQDFLSSRLLNIGADDSRLEKLDATCTELAQTYANNPKAAMVPLLAAWDPAAGDDRALLAIDEVLQKHWPTFRGAFSDEPLTLYRAVVLEAVMRAMKLQGTLAVAVSLVAANILPRLQVGQEARILSNLLGRADAITSERLKQAWPKQAEAGQLSPLEVPAIRSLKKLDVNTWFSKVAAASGPGTNKPDVSLSQPNPHWPNQPQHWSYEFADRMAPLLADVHDAAAANALKVTGQALKALGDAVAAKLDEFLSAEQARSHQRESASRLLWWRQSLYSETAETPYRKLTAAFVAWHMALDVSDLLPEVYPAAVESLLFEAVRAATGAEADTELTMSELLGVVGQTSQLATIEWVKEQQTTKSRSLLVQALANSFVVGHPELPELGIGADTKMLPGDWAIWLLREVKALDAIRTPDELEQTQEQA